MSRSSVHSHQPTTLEDWTRADKYNVHHLLPADPILEAAIKESEDNGLPDISVTDVQGKFLHLLMKSIGAKRILEVGTLGGYSTIWLARALPEDGRLITFEINEKHAAVAAKNIENAGLSDKVEIQVGPAAESLKKIKDDATFDFCFIDADKPSNLTYFKEAKRLVRKGGVIIVDNFLRHGRVSDLSITNEDDIMVAGVRAVLEYVKTDKEVDATAMGTVGAKGFDGFMYAVRL